MNKVHQRNDCGLQAAESMKETTGSVTFLYEVAFFWFFEFDVSANLERRTQEVVNEQNTMSLFRLHYYRENTYDVMK